MCLDVLFSLFKKLKKTNEFMINIHHILIDFKIAYDSINRDQLYMVMMDLNIPLNLIFLVKMTMREVKIEADLSDSFDWFETCLLYTSQNIIVQSREQLNSQIGGYQCGFQKGGNAQSRFLV